ncbi:helix-turn-helix domain-containing protein [Xanthomonas albilineans]|uniref:helix-turn-helix domain-containing protein n=1 Tax=Xanthomonas albilineans TaxID=29447 RepID=UPI0005F34CAC|nr:helix-turn-helix transcriptional regulator [Xanthomonas albilineans]
MSFSNTLKRLRLARGLTQEKLALACGWNGQSRIANYESNSPKAREPKLSELPVIARALGVSLEELLGDNDLGDAGTGVLQSENITFRLHPQLISRTHAFLEVDRSYDLSLLTDATLFAKAYEWLAQQGEVVDSPQSFNKFLRWAAVQQSITETRTASNQPRVGRRDHLSEFADAEIVNDPFTGLLADEAEMLREQEELTRLIEERRSASGKLSTETK